MIDNITLAMMGAPAQPPATIEEETRYKNRNSAENNVNLRDTLSVLVANKTSPKDLSRSLQDVAFAIGATDKTGAVKDPATYEKARKLLTKASIFNQRSDIQQLSPKDRVTTFFDLYKGDKEVGDVINTVRSLGSGVGANYNDSPMAGLGQFPLVGAASGNSPASQQLASRLEKKIAQK